MRRSLVAVAILFIFTLSCQWRQRSAAPVQEEAPVKQDTVYPLGFCTDSFRLVKGVVAGGATFSGLMSSLGLSGEDAYQLIQASDSIFDVRKFRAGAAWQAYYKDSTDLRYLVYEEGSSHHRFYCICSIFNVALVEGCP